MRLFVAAYPSPAALAALAAALPELRPQWRPVPQEQWHLTLAFLGDVAEGALAELRGRLGRAAGRSGPLVCGLAGAGAFPSAGRARVLWAGVSGDRDGLVRLAERVSAAARRTGIAVEERSHRPHLTVARARLPRGVDATAVIAAMQFHSGPLEPVPEIVLVRSDLGSGVRHERLAAWPLRPESGSADGG